MLLVNLSKGLVGPEAAALLGSLVVAELWQALLERAAVPPRERHPVHLVIDEVQDYLRLPLDLADALAQARSLGGGFTLAHQYLGQLPTSMRTALLANAHSRVCFQLAPDDAVAIAHGHPELEPADLTALGAYTAYASLLAGDRRAAYASIQTMPLPAATSNERLLRARSRQRYGQPLDEIEAGFARLLTDAAPVAATGRRPRRSP